MNTEPSFASLLMKQSPSMHYGHGWIEGKNGKCWHSSYGQSELLNSLQTKRKPSVVEMLLRIIKESK